jgi:hypothetical protein
MSNDVLQLFEEFAARYAAGEAPDPRPYLDRAGEQAGRLAALIERHVEAAPLRTPGPDEVAVLESWLERGEPTLLALRVRKGLTRDAVVDALGRALEIAAARRDKLAGYYHQLENGLLDPSRVDARVFAVLAKLFGVQRSELVVLPGRPLVPEQVYFRRTEPSPLPSLVFDKTFPAPAEPAQAGKPAERDEVDRLFLGPAD